MAFRFSAVYCINCRAKLRKEKRYQEAVLKMLLAEETARRCIAAGLHDGVGQTLTTAWLNLRPLALS